MLTLSKSMHPLAKHLLLQDKFGVFFSEKLKLLENCQDLITQTDKPIWGSFHLLSYYVSKPHKWKLLTSIKNVTYAGKNKP